MRPVIRARRRLPVALAVLAGAMAGCGGDDDEKPSGGGKKAAAAGAPKPKEPLKAVLPRFEKVLQSGDCRDLVRYGSPSSTRSRPNARPDDPPTRTECRELQRFQRALRGFRSGKVAEFGTAGVVDGKDEIAPGKVASTAWTIDTDGSWRVVFFTGIEPQVGKRPKPSTASDFDAVARQWVEAAKKGDCKALWRLSEAESRFVRNAGGDRAKYCRAVSGVRKGREPHTIKDFAQSPDARPEHLGATPNVAFYGVRFPSGRYVTLDVTTVGEAVPAKLRRGHASPGIENYVVNRNPR
jgi:hypothetical protein